MHAMVCIKKMHVMLPKKKNACYGNEQTKAPLPNIPCWICDLKELE